MLAEVMLGLPACRELIMTGSGTAALLKRYTRQFMEHEPPKFLPKLTDDEINAVVEDIAEFAGVRPIRLRNGASTDTARPYRDAFWWILNKKFKMDHRSIAKFFNTSRTTVGTGIKAVENDPDRQSKRAVILARMTRMGVGI